MLIDDRFSMTNKFISNFNDSMSLFSSFKHSINQFLMINLNFHYQFSSCDFENSMNSIVSTFFVFIVLSTTNSITTFNEINQHLLHNNVTCYAYFKKKLVHMICVDIDSSFFLMSKFCLHQNYSNLFIYSMTNQKKLKCIEIEIEFVITNKCVNVSMRFRNKNNNYVKIVIQIHVISQLKCDMIFEIFILKSNDITLFWSSNEIHVKNHVISIQIFFESISTTKEKILFTSILTTKFNVFSFIQRRIKKNIRHVFVYANKTMIFESNQNVNISIRHRFLSKNKNYLFEFIFQIDIVIDQFLIEIQTMIENDQKIISMNNFEITQIKILKNQIIN